MGSAVSKSFVFRDPAFGVAASRKIPEFNKVECSPCHMLRPVTEGPVGRLELRAERRSSWLDLRARTGPSNDPWMPPCVGGVVSLGVVPGLVPGTRQWMSQAQILRSTKVRRETQLEHSGHRSQVEPETDHSRRSRVVRGVSIGIWARPTQASGLRCARRSNCTGRIA
jgi:hypothetical protein